MTEAAFDISCAKLKTLPDNLLSQRQNIQIFYCLRNQLTSLPDNLPQRLKELWCSYNQLTSLPDNLPQGLQILYCQYNRLTSLPDNLPQGLQRLYCENNQLTSLPDELPQGLQQLYCPYNQLTSLPDNLPQRLKELYCYHNQLTILPDLPTSLKYISLHNNPLEHNYPHIFMYKSVEDVVKYVNTRNRLRRAKWLSIVNAGNVLLERYMQRMMHPSRFEHLKTNPDIDVDEYMARHVESL